MHRTDTPPDFDCDCHRRATLERVWEDLWVKRGPKPAHGRLLAILSVGLPSAIDRLTRHLDRIAGRSFHGRWQRLFAQGHSLVPWLCMLPAILFTMLGPTPRWRGLPVAAAAAAGLLAYLACVRLWPGRRSQGQGLLGLQWLVLAVLSGLLWWQSGPASLEADAAPYRHVFAPILLVLLLVAALAFPLANWVLKGLGAEHAARLAGLLAWTELFDTPRRPEPSLRRFLHGLVNAPLYNPLHLLLLPALPVVLVPRHYAQPAYAALWLAISWLILTFAGMYDRLNLAVRVVKQMFLIGGQGVVSVTIIGLALLRLAGVDYVSTLLDTASARVVSLYIVAAYSAFWLYEYWINRALTERLLPLLDDTVPAGERRAWVPYRVHREAVASRVRAEGRAIEVFAGGRFVVTGAYLDPDSQTVCGQWQPYERDDLFQRLADTALRANDPDETYRTHMAVAEVDKRCKLYFNLLNIGLLALALGVAFGLHRVGKQLQRPGAQGQALVGQALAMQPVDLRTLVVTGNAARRPKIALAVSGGGTRAALYAASVLRGLAQLGRAGDVVLISGVSGGGAALTYFAIHQAELVAATPRPCGPAELERLAAQPEPEAGEDPWCRFIEVMARPYIDDVLRGVAELQVLGAKTTGHLLQESLARGLDAHAPAPTALSGIRDLGLILNATLAGHPATPDDALAPCPAGQAPGAPASASSRATEPWRSSASGGIVAFTNLRNLGAFPVARRAMACAPDERLPYLLVGGEGTRLTAAAALAANFPPVFPNAGVDVEHAGAVRRYWVTDGGAAENRGVVSLLYALRSLVDDCADPPSCHNAMPDLQVLVVDASALSFDYQPDRGVGAMLGASAKFSGQLMLELADGTARAYDALGPGRLAVSYLPMPVLLRSRGGLGTHWMMPAQVTLRDDAALSRSDARVLSRPDRWQTMALLTCLHDTPPAPPSQGPCAALKAGALGERLAADPHTPAWQALVRQLAIRP
ncbi:hypothetical protein [Piscinibacter gummiphilus]|uniref:PNPLA domain-containing protein n=1 Tax=Piscinibacter gummiphilus TaxID=946333 RepID=A0ABZ0CY43_9BURK|nr:hypothetical protein [Piscinibacter gummiphilus]WOB07798.1 hypothetical protein RXV79_23180 [Piscinibacter gummiphilus]